jgi:acyl carrier protein
MPDTVANNEQIRQIITDILEADADTVVPEAVIEEELGGDVLDRVDITMSIEQAFALRLTDDEVEACSTVGDWQQLVERRLA